MVLCEELFQLYCEKHQKNEPSSMKRPHAEDTAGPAVQTDERKNDTAEHRCNNSFTSVSPQYHIVIARIISALEEIEEEMSCTDIYISCISAMKYMCFSIFANCT